MKIALTSDLHRGFSVQTAEIHDKWAEKFAAEDFDVLVVAGDLASHIPEHLKECLLLAKKIAGKRPVAVVLGNHDWWDVNHTLTIQELRDSQLKSLRDTGVHYLQDDGPLVVDGVAILGWDGWWNSTAWDYSRMPIGTPDFASALVTPAFQRMLDHLDNRPQEWRAAVAVSHFPITSRPTGGRHNDIDFGGNPRLWPELVGRVNVFCYGHTHEAHDEIIDDVRVVNAGNDYDKPTFKIVEV